MDPKELRGLYEAYNEVYAPQEVDEATAMAKRGYDETKLRKRAGGGEAADRATALENKPTYGDSRKQSQREKYARAQRGDFRKTASSSPGLHGYAYKSNDPVVKAKQAARGAQRGALTPNEKKQLNMGDETFDLFDVVLEFLQVEGYAETLEEAEWMMANIIDEEAIDIILGEEQLDEISTELAGRVVNARIGRTGRAFDKEMKDSTPENMRASMDAADKEARAKRLAAGVRTRREEFVGEEQLDEDPVTGALIGGALGIAAGAKGAHYAAKKTKRLRDYPKNFVKGIVDPRTYFPKKKKEQQKEEYMDEAQVANRDTDKYEADQNKKYAPVRGEKTPMPPRGDKRREDFEKWYAKQMGR